MFSNSLGRLSLDSPATTINLAELHHSYTSHLGPADYLPVRVLDDGRLAPYEGEDRHPDEIPGYHGSWNVPGCTIQRVDGAEPYTHLLTIPNIWGDDEWSDGPPPPFLTTHGVTR